MNQNPQISQIEHLRSERKSYIVGSLVVLGVCYIVDSILAAMILWPYMMAQPMPGTFSEQMQRMMSVMPKLTEKPHYELVVVQLVGAVALFFLNWRFSLLIRRPRATFAQLGFSWPRLGWWLVLFLVSMYFMQLIPELILIGILAHWGRQEIDRLQSQPSPNVPDSNS